MDINDIDKVVNRKRLKDNSENLREKVTREITQIIKVRVSQDTAYWDLKEKLQQSENNHEHLHQNMVEVQMQYESISGQYQEELRLRPETLNKLISTREICDVLEDYSEKLKETLSRCKADQVALYDAYQKSASVVRDTRCEMEQKEKYNEQYLENLREKEKSTSEQHIEVLKFLTSTKQQVDSELADARAKLTTVQTQRDQLLSNVKELNVEVEKYKHELMMKEQMLVNLRDELRMKIEECNKCLCEARNTIAKRESELKEASERCESLKQALCYQEHVARSISNEKSTLQEQNAALEEQHGKLTADIEALRTKMERMCTMKENVEHELQSSTDEKNRMQKEIFDYIQKLTNGEQERQQLQSKIELLNKEKFDAALEVNRLMDDIEAKRVEIEKLLEQESVLKRNCEEIDNASKSYREEAETTIKNLQAESQSKDKDIETKINVINTLDTEVKMGTDARIKLEGVVQTLKMEIEQERNTRKEREMELGKKIEHLEATVKDKEQELNEQLTVILEARNNKERLEHTVQDLRQTIDNVNKELNGKPQDTRRKAEPEVMAATLAYPPKMMAPQSAFTRNRHQLEMSRNAPKEADERLYVFSDDSGNAIDTDLVKSRFAALARGEQLPPLPSSAFKRRSNPQQTHTPSTLTQGGSVVNDKNRRFFKTKRLDSKIKNKKKTCSLILN